MQSPNHGLRRGVSAPDIVVLHYTGMASCQAAAERLCDPVAEVSAHYLVDVDGTVLSLVPEERRAWHAGQGAWGAVTDVNSHSVGIEIANPGHHDGYPPFPEAQMTAVQHLLSDALSRWAIPPERVIGHACMAPGRKIDPGEKFDWRRLALSGHAVWLDYEGGSSAEADATVFQEAARRFGYPVPATGEWCAESLAVWRAFAMRFLPWWADQAPDAAAVRHLQRLAEQWPVG
ncbi:MAG: N-acetylmuramoyl-L-alanine amidase [Pseudomonadota bacterium]